MEQKSKRIIGFRVVIGLFLFTFGVLFLLKNFGLVEVGNVFQYWPVFFIILGLLNFYHHRTMGGLVWSTILIIIGVGMLAPIVFGVEFNIFDFWPVILILVGLSMILKSVRSPRCHTYKLKEETSDGSYFKATTFAGGVRKIILSKDFISGDITAIMGGVQLDLRDADIKNEALLDVYIIMGGVEILIPPEWSVQVDAIPVLGGISDSTQPPKISNSKLLKIQGTIIMGGIEVKNYSDDDWRK